MSRLEGLAYKLEPAGHESPPVKRICKTADRKLAQLFEDYLNKYHWNRDNYGKTEKAIKGLNVSVTAMHALLIAYQDHKNLEEGAGEFVSAVYNKVPDKEIIFDLKIDVQIEKLGMMLAKNKTLINKAVVGDYLGAEAEGTIINESKAGNTMAVEAQGPVINKGITGHFFGENATGVLINYGFSESIGGDSDNVDGEKKTYPVIINYGKALHVGTFCNSLIVNLNDAGDALAQNALKDSLAINFGKVKRLGSASKGYVVAASKPEAFGAKLYVKRLVKEDDCKYVPELRKYLNNLKAKLMEGKNDYRIALRAVKDLGPNPNIKMAKDIDAILKKAGYEI